MGLSYAQIEGYWVQAGGDPSKAAIMAAIAMAETGGSGDPNSHNPIPPDDSYGLWQVNMLGSLGPARRAQFGLSSNTQLFDPLTNAKAAVAISANGTNLSPWTTFTSGKYKQYLNGSVPPNLSGGGAAGAGGGAQAQTAAYSIFDSMTDLVAKIGDYIWMGGLFFAGGVFMVAGIWLIFKATPAAAPVAEAVRTIGNVATLPIRPIAKGGKGRTMSRKTAHATRSTPVRRAGAPPVKPASATQNKPAKATVKPQREEADNNESRVQRGGFGATGAAKRNPGSQ